MRDGNTLSRQIELIPGERVVQSVHLKAWVLALPAAIPVVRATAGFTEGFTFALWAFGTA